MPNISDKRPRKQPQPSDIENDDRPPEIIRIEREALEWLARGEPRAVPMLREANDELDVPRWQDGLRIGKEGNPTRDPGNAALILSNDPAWAGLRFDEFTGRPTWENMPPVMGMNKPASPDGFEVYVGHWFATVWNASFSVEAIRAAISYAAHQRTFHQVRDYLDGLEWDGVKRISTWLPDYLGSADSEVIRAMGRMWLISAVARAYKPGSKTDHMLVLEGGQGVGKTTALEALCSAEWFQPELGDLRNKDTLIALRGKWIVCMDELHALRTVDLTELAKNFLTRTVDKYRPLFARDEIDQPRSCVFSGTTNADAYLNDPTGNRRFWPVKVATEKSIDLEGIKRDRDQLWAEARDAFLGSEKWWPQKETADLLAEETALRAEGDPWDKKVTSYIAGREYVSVSEILSDLGIEPGNWKHGDQMRVAKILSRAKWLRRQVRKGNLREWRYEPPVTNETGD